MRRICKEIGRMLIDKQIDGELLIIRQTGREIE